MSNRDTFSNQTGRGNANRAQVSKTMKRMVRRCKGCGRGQNPRMHFHLSLDARPFWQCRYCKGYNDSEGFRPS